MLSWILWCDNCQDNVKSETLPETMNCPTCGERCRWVEVTDGERDS